MNSKDMFRIALFALSVLVSLQGQAEEVRDYYAEPGLNPFKEASQDGVESIDPFSGALQIHHVDMVIPGNGGLDIEINRVYTNIQGDNVGSRGVTGVGWTQHFGRIVVPEAHKTKICTQVNWQTHTNDNPSIEFPDGAREMLVLRNDSSGRLITKSNWMADCTGVSSGLRVTSPTGVKYYMDVTEASQGQTSWYTSRIVDLDGNEITISYGLALTGQRYITSVNASDGRSVTYNYLDQTNGRIRLDNIIANGQSVSYQYQTIPGISGDYYQLTRATRPDGLSWQYGYYPKFVNEGISETGSYSMSQLTYPHGAIVNYSYQLVSFSTNPIKTTSIATKSTSGPGIVSGSWSWAFIPATAVNTPDVTQVTTPHGITQYFHQGYVSGGSLVWPVGLLVQQRELNSSGQRIRQINNDWGRRVISNENQWHGRTNLESEFSVPILRRQYNFMPDTPGGTSGTNLETGYLNHDYFGSARTIEEERQYLADGCSAFPCFIQTSKTFLNDETRWVIGLPLTEIKTDVGTITRAYYSGNRRLQSITEYGVATNYAYTTQGDLASETNARGFVHSYSNYHRGQARNESWQVDASTTISTSRVINPTGTVASRTDGEGNTIGFTYDGLNRLTAINYLLGSDVSISYGLRSSTLTRGNYREEKSFNGFYQETAFIRRDLGTSEAITINTQYDQSGRMLFKSLPNSASGIATQYDALGRVTRITQPNLAFKTFAYGGFTLPGGSTEGDIRITDERGKVSVIGQDIQGSEGQSLGINLEVVDEDRYTVINRDKAGNISSVFQGDFDPATGGGNNGYSNDYGYNTSLQLVSIFHPETGLTIYGRDAVGNMIDRTVGSSGLTAFTYDGLNRLKTINYPGITPDVAYTYDDNSQPLTVSRGSIVRTMTYDQNTNLDTETLAVGSNFFYFDYDYDGLDHLSVLRYPDNVQETFAPNAFGRPTRVSGYVTAVGYHPNSAVASMTYGNGAITQVTQNSRQLTQGIQVTRGSQLVNLNYGFDAIGNITTVTDAVSSSRSLAMTYDGLNRLATASGAWGSASYSYNGLGNIEQYSLGTQTLTYAYNSNRLAQVTGYQSSVLSWVMTPTHDVYGNMTSNRDAAFQFDNASNLVLADGIQYQYDGADRLTIESTTTTNPTYTIYNHAGTLLFERNDETCRQSRHLYVGSLMVAKTDDPSSDGDGDGVGNACDAFPNNANYQQDTDGDGLPDNHELAIGTNPNVANANAATLDSDGDGHTDLTEISANSDPRNNASNPSPTPSDADIPFVPGIFLAVMAGLFALINGRRSRSIHSIALFGLLSLGAVFAPDLQAGVTYYHHDAQGSAVAATNESGTLLWRKHYAPYGAETAGQVSTASAPEQYTGKRHDNRTGLTYLGGRHYDPLLGRFISADPAGFDAGELTTFNRYAYANNNPYRFVDPNGESILDIAFLVVDVVKLGGAMASGNPAAIQSAAIDVAFSVVGTLSPFPGVGQLGKKTYQTINKVADAAGGAKAARATDTLQPGVFAKESIPARGPNRDFTKTERDQINDIGTKHGCHTCGTKSPGTKSGDFIPDHQTPNKLNTNNNPQILLPHCKTCSLRQGGQVRQATRK